MVDERARKAYLVISTEILSLIEGSYSKLINEGRCNEYAKAYEHQLKVSNRVYGAVLGFYHLGLINEYDMMDLNLAFDERAYEIRDKWLPYFDITS